MLEATDGGKELVDALLSIARGVMPNIAAQEGSRPRKDQQVRPADQLKAIEMLLDRGFGRSPRYSRHSLDSSFDDYDAPPAGDSNGSTWFTLIVITKWLSSKT